MPRATKICMRSHLVGLQQESINYSLKVIFDSSPGVRSFTWVCIVKSLEIFLSLTIRASNFSPVQGSYVQHQLAKYCNVWHVGILCISHWNDTGPSWPSCFSVQWWPQVKHGKVLLGQPLTKAVKAKVCFIQGGPSYVSTVQWFHGLYFLTLPIFHHLFHAFR